MIAFIFLIIVLPIVLLITAIVMGTAIIVDAIYDIGKSLHKGEKPINKYRKI